MVRVKCMQGKGLMYVGKNDKTLEASRIENTYELGKPQANKIGGGEFIRIEPVVC